MSFACPAMSLTPRVLSAISGVGSVVLVPAQGIEDASGPAEAQVRVALGGKDAYVHIAAPAAVQAVLQDNAQQLLQREGDAHALPRVEPGVLGEAGYLLRGEDNGVHRVLHGEAYLPLRQGRAVEQQGVEPAVSAPYRADRREEDERCQRVRRDEREPHPVNPERAAQKQGAGGQADERPEAED